MKMEIECTDKTILVKLPETSEQVTFIDVDHSETTRKMISFILGQLTGDALYVSEKSLGRGIMKRVESHFGQEEVETLLEYYGVEKDDYGRRPA